MVRNKLRTTAFGLITAMALISSEILSFLVNLASYLVYVFFVNFASYQVYVFFEDVASYSDYLSPPPPVHAPSNLCRGPSLAV